MPFRSKFLSLMATASMVFGAAGIGRSQTLVTHSLPATLAMEAVEAAVAACTRQGFGVTATVIDADAQRIAVLRGGTAGVHTYDAAWGKAYTAVGFAPLVKVDSSGEVARRIAEFAARQPPGTLPFQAPEHMIFRAGGLTIKLGEEVIGAIGVGGSPTAEGDEACARAGLDKIRDRIR
ncbi:MAG TPA: heme-binding protein [Stellaceae bacterium]|nr:heme-binding protein [Stellaceae bacterium]